MSGAPILVTGAAGFIGAHVVQALAARGDAVIGLDNFNDYYDPQLKRDRVAALCPDADIRVLDIADGDALAALFDEVRPDRVVHLAAQAGVRYSLQNPQAYIDSNVVGFMNVLEGCRYAKVQHLVYASSSSVYGGNTRMPFSERDSVDHPVSIYAATKKANELIDNLAAGKEVRSTRGARLTSWRQAERVLAGFPDGLADEGPTAGPASLEGLRVAREGRRSFRCVSRSIEAGLRPRSSAASTRFSARRLEKVCVVMRAILAPAETEN